MRSTLRRFDDATQLINAVHNCCNVSRKFRIKLDPEAPNLPARKSSLGQQQQPSSPAPAASPPVILSQRTELLQNAANYGYIVANNTPTAATDPSGGGGGGGGSESQTELPLSKCEWYFGKADRDFVREKLKGARDGTFMVRDSTSGNGEYTLTLKKDGTDRVIKIYNNNGRYGFTKGSVGLNFASVPELVNHYRKTSLKDYNRILDIKLLYPLSRYAKEDEDWLNNDVDKLVQKYLEIRKELSARIKDYEENTNKYKRTEQELELKRQAFEAFHEAEQLFDEQLQAAKRFEAEAQPHELPKLKENHDRLKARLGELLYCKDEMKWAYEAQKKLFFTLERNLQSLMPTLTELRKNEDRYIQ